MAQDKSVQKYDVLFKKNANITKMEQRMMFLTKCIELKISLQDSEYIFNLLVLYVWDILP